ncbi:lipopolysaccharide biosynthesis protein [Stutzerimonas stutzeri]|uniref:lipopolysaccharide biosynthesis protein n=1 Tax=Stutzerimonas stutzeri TaxID=316 RepID=UPI001F446562|nr:oligosaccharide flippase family protein [Stutzerimonas stutzeri]
MPSLDLPEKLVAARQRLTGGSSANVFKGMATLAVGNGLARVVGLAAIPILTRIYSPEHFGVLSIFTALLLILTPLMTLRYEVAVPLPGRDGTAMNLMALSAILIVATSLTLSCVLWLAGPILLTMASMEALIPYRWLLAIALPSAGLYELLLIWAVRRRAYPAIARTQLQQSAVGSIAKVALGGMGMASLGLLAGQVLGAGAGTVTLMQRFQVDAKRYWRHVTLSRIRFMVHRYKGFPSYRLPSQLLLLLSSQAPLLLTASLYDPKTTGQLGLALMTLALPMNLLGHTTSKAYYAEIASIGRKHPAKIRAITYSVIKRLLALSLVPTLMLLAFGRDLFSIAFGEEWVLAGELASMLAIYLMFQFMHAPVSHLLAIYEGQRLLLALNLQRAGLTAACFAAAHFLDLPITTVIMLYALTLSAHYLFSLLLTLKVIPSHGADS